MLKRVWTTLARLQAEVSVTKTPDGGVEVKTPVYEVSIGKDGSLGTLSVKGAPALAHRFVDQPGDKPFANTVVNVTGSLVAVRSGTARAEWSFAEDEVKLVCEGYNFAGQVDPSVRMTMVTGGKNLPYDAKQYGGGGVMGLVLANDLTAAFSIPMHIQRQRLLPNGYTNGGLKPGVQAKPGRCFAWAASNSSASCAVV